MPRIIAPLTDARIKNAKPRDKLYKMFDVGSLSPMICRHGYLDREI